MAGLLTEHPTLKPIVRAGLLPAVAMCTVSRRHYSSREDGHNRLADAGSRGAGCLGDEAARQRSTVRLRAKLHNCLFCYLTIKAIVSLPDEGNLRQAIRRSTLPGNSHFDFRPLTFLQLGITMEAWRL